MDELDELCELNVELMETLLVVAKRLFEYATKHGIKSLDGLDSLHRLVKGGGKTHRRNDFTAKKPTH